MECLVFCIVNFSYDPQYDTLKSITIDCLKFNAGYFGSIVILAIWIRKQKRQ